MDIFYLLTVGLSILLILILIFIITAAIVFKIRKNGKAKRFVILSAVCAVLLAADIAFIIFFTPKLPPLPPIEEKEMPRLVGLSFFECRSDYSDQFDMTVENQEYSSEYPEGTIIQQYPSAGKNFLVGRTTVKCVVRKGIRYVGVPTLSVLTLKMPKNS